MLKHKVGQRSNGNPIVTLIHYNDYINRLGSQCIPFTKELVTNTSVGVQPGGTDHLHFTEAMGYTSSILDHMKTMFKYKPTHMFYSLNIVDDGIYLPQLQATIDLDSCTHDLLDAIHSNTKVVTFIPRVVASTCDDGVWHKVMLMAGYNYLITKL